MWPDSAHKQNIPLGSFTFVTCPRLDSKQRTDNKTPTSRTKQYPLDNTAHLYPTVEIVEFSHRSAKLAEDRQLNL